MVNYSDVKKTIISFIVFLILWFSFLLYMTIGNNTKSNHIKEIVYDTVYLYVPDSSLVEVNDSLYYIIDSLEYELSNTKATLDVAEFKLERIREYNTIAANGNNIKYLRGWINRVLEN